MIITSIFILAFSYYIARGVIKTPSVLALKAKSIKPQVEMVVPVKTLAHVDGKTLHLDTYLEEKRRERQKCKTQKLRLELMPDSMISVFYLN
ncbi:hypothetical protein RCC89_12115 [Cytophagaceae bacterium ABcell3]|nr:hypothetical protein RCC89_12115 [Cytophagaceae bacterium ABcell3]